MVSMGNDKIERRIGREIQNNERRNTMKQERTMNMSKNTMKRRQILTLLIVLCMAATVFAVPVSYAGEKELKQSTVTNGSLAKNGISAAQRLKKYKGKDFYAVPYKPNGEILLIEFGKVSGKTVKLTIKHGTAYCCYESENVKGKISGKKVKFTVKNWSTIVADANAPGGLKEIRIPTKTTGTITLVNDKTIKLKVNSRHDKNNELEKFGKMLNAKKTKKLKRSDTIPELSYNY